jgi:hypothetical protein
MITVPEPSLATILAIPQSQWWAILQDWWWLFLIVDVFWIGKVFLYFWYEWRKEVFDAKENEPRVLLEIKIPEEVLEPVKAMETVITGFWQIWKDPNWFEKWWEGEDPIAFTLEIASIDGIPHFYARMPARVRPIFETHIYSQYPQAEISPAEDYTKNVPQDIPNNKWDMWGTEYKNLKPWAYPIKTYTEFEEGTEKEEKRIDPIASLLEGMARLKPGEQLWVQLRCLPVLAPYVTWVPAGKKLRDKLAYRQDSEYKPKPFIQEIFNFILTGKLSEPPKKEAETPMPLEMKLTPGERLILMGIERKISKLGFLCNLKYIYLGKREVFFSPNNRLAMSYFTNFVTDNMNALVPSSETITKIKKNWYDWFYFAKQRTFVRKRRLFRAYVQRTWVGYPNPCVKSPDEEGRRFILTAEEIASLYHFPGKIVASAPALARVETKKGEAPSGLPVE